MKITDGWRVAEIRMYEWKKGEEWCNAVDFAEEYFAVDLIGREKVAGSSVWIVTEEEYDRMEECLNEWKNFVDEIYDDAYGPDQWNRDYDFEETYTKEAEEELF